MTETRKDLWVFIESGIDGDAKSVGLELLGPGRRLAGEQGGKLVGVVIGYKAEAAIRAANDYGADEIIVVDGPEYENYTTDAYVHAFFTLVEKYGPTTILIGATNNGRDMGPRLACRLKTGLTADCTALDIDQETGKVAWTKPTYGSNLMATISCPDSLPQMGTVRPGVFKKETPDSSRMAVVIRENISFSANNIRTTLLETIKITARELVNLEGAEIIVSGGQGVEGPEGFKLLRELADVLAAAVGASRAAVDAGWISHSHMVGQTGKTVSPKLYIACGISGAVQHLTGISGADVIIAINKDPDAPIFDIATYGVVGSLHEVIPALTSLIKMEKKKE